MSASLAFDGTNYIIIWQDERNGFSDIYGARVSPPGTVLDTSGILISNAIYVYAQHSPAIAFDGANYLVVWEDLRNDSSDIYGARVSPPGTVLDTSGILISNAIYVYAQHSPAIAFDGANYLVVWEDLRNDSSDIYGARVSPSGTVLDTAGIPISTATNDQMFPSIASYSTNYLVVWQDERSGSNDDIYGARVSPSGTVLDTAGIPISTAAGWQVFPAIAFDGTNYNVVWQDLRSDDYSDIYGVQVSPYGLISWEFVVSVQPGDQITPALAHGFSDTLFAAYAGFVDSITGHPANTMRIWGKFYKYISVEEISGKLPETKPLLLAYPNPFSEIINIRCTTQDKRFGIEKMSLKIYDVTGRLVRDLTDNLATSIMNHASVVSWDGNDNSGHRLPGGVYFVQLKVDGYKQVEKVILSR